jgi:hypothetical protein
MAQTPEGKVKKKLDKMLKEFEPDLWFYSPQAGIYGKSGVPDRMCCYFGRLIGIEVKADETKGPTDLQHATMQAMSRAGAMCFVVNSDTTLNAVREFLISMKTRDRILT